MGDHLPPWRVQGACSTTTAWKADHSKPERQRDGVRETGRLAAFVALGHDAFSIPGSPPALRVSKVHDGQNPVDLMQIIGYRHTLRASRAMAGLISALSRIRKASKEIGVGEAQAGCCRQDDLPIWRFTLFLFYLRWITLG